MPGRLSNTAAFTVGAALAAFGLRRIVLMAARADPAYPQTGEASRRSVCVIVPARDEALVVGGVLEDLARIGDSGVSVVLVDDGSNDQTAAIMERWARVKPNWSSVRLDPGVGKAGALNAGIAASRDCELIAVCDADVRVAPDSLRELVRVFDDPRVGACSALLWPENADESSVSRYCALELWQHQLITSAGKERLQLNPPARGAFSCYRREAIEQIGGFAPGSLGEDVEASAALVALGWRTRFAAGARVTGKVPSTVSDYLYQHVRWARGLHDAAPPRDWPNAPMVRRIEGWLHAAGYLDRVLLPAAFILSARGALPSWAPVGYVGLTGAEAMYTLALAGQLRAAPRFLAAIVKMIGVDVAASVIGSSLQLVGARRTWHSPARGMTT